LNNGKPLIAEQNLHKITTLVEMLLANGITDPQWGLQLTLPTSVSASFFRKVSN
jgi:hypothetical protein